MLSNVEGEMAEINIDDVQTGGADPLIFLKNGLKKTTVDNASIILNIHKANIIFGQDNTIKFFYILDKYIRNNIKSDNTRLIINDHMLDNILNKIKEELNLPDDIVKNDSYNNAENIKKYLDFYKGINIKKYLFLLLEPGIAYQINNPNIENIFKQLNTIRFSYTSDSKKKNPGDHRTNIAIPNEYKQYIENSHDQRIVYMNCVFLFLKIIKKIIASNLGEDTLKNLYDNFGKLAENINNDDINDKIRDIKESYAIIKEKLIIDNVQLTKIANNIIIYINNLNKIQNWRSIMQYINFNGFDDKLKPDKKINLIKILIFLLYNIDDKNDGFVFDNTSFLTIFNSTEKDKGISINESIIKQQIENDYKNLVSTSTPAATATTAAAAAPTAIATTAALEDALRPNPFMSTTSGTKEEERNEGDGEKPEGTDADQIDLSLITESSSQPGIIQPTTPITANPKAAATQQQLQASQQGGRSPNGGKKKQTQKCRKKYSKNKTR